jgi:hypothetical protein
MASDGPVKKLQRNVAYFFDEEQCNYNYGGGNPMRPHRHRLTTNLVQGYGLHDRMHVLRPRPRTRDEIMHFHADGGWGLGGWRGRKRRAGACCARGMPAAFSGQRRVAPAASIACCCRQSRAGAQPWVAQGRVQLAGSRAGNRHASPPPYPHTRSRTLSARRRPAATARFCPADYVDFLTSVTPENQEEFMMQVRRLQGSAVAEACDRAHLCVRCQRRVLWWRRGRAGSQSWRA